MKPGTSVIRTLDYSMGGEDWIIPWGGGGLNNLETGAEKSVICEEPWLKFETPEPQTDLYCFCRRPTILFNYTPRYFG